MLGRLATPESNQIHTCLKSPFSTKVRYSPHLRCSRLERWARMLYHGSYPWVSIYIYVLYMSIYRSAMKNWCIYLHECLILMGFHVGEYTSPMDSMGYITGTIAHPISLEGEKLKIKSGSIKRIVEFGPIQLYKYNNEPMLTPLKTNESPLKFNGWFR